jgi:hypothetical protein
MGILLPTTVAVHDGVASKLFNDFNELSDNNIDFGLFTSRRECEDTLPTASVE